MNYSKLFHKTKGQIEKYSKIRTKGLSNKIRRTVSEVCYGILQSGDSLITEIARSLHEKTSIHKTIERLSRNLNEINFVEKLEKNHLNNIKSYVNEESLIVIDDSDITKPRAKSMEGLCPIRDASKDETGMGYYLQQSCLVSKDRKKITSLTTNVYSTREPGFISRGMERELFFRV